MGLTLGSLNVLTGIDAIDAIAHGKPSAMAASPTLSSASLSFSWHCPVTL
jgi:hypothetical protein